MGGAIQYDATHAGTQINVFYPNSNDAQRCADAGTSRIRIQPAAGFGTMIVQDVATVLGHPGIFFVGDRVAPVGSHLDGEWMACASVAECAGRPVSFELASAGAGFDGSLTLTLLSITTVDTGVEDAVVRLPPNTPAGTYQLQVRNTDLPEETSLPLPVAFGAPITG